MITTIPETYRTADEAELTVAERAARASNRDVRGPEDHQMHAVYRAPTAAPPPDVRGDGIAGTAQPEIIEATEASDDDDDDLGDAEDDFA